MGQKNSAMNKDYVKFNKEEFTGKILQANVRIHKHFTKYPKQPWSYKRKIS